ncbi:MAG: SprT-like domain-containing protein [Bacteroidales bacterium]|nr:SprT-like domain-containing protein [Bacteroidales bacterium]
MTESEIEKNKDILRRYLPPSAVDPIFDYIRLHNIHFNIKRTRTSKYGDYRCPTQSHKYHEISVNGDLAPHFFLLVMLHEMAHLETNLSHGRTVQPHGHEWQRHYRELIIEYAQSGHFPKESLPLISKYTARIPLNHAKGKALERLLMGDKEMPYTLVQELAINSTFRLKAKPDLRFVVLKKNRTRYQCLCLNDNRRYSVSGEAEVLENE